MDAFRRTGANGDSFDEHGAIGGRQCALRKRRPIIPHRGKLIVSTLVLALMLPATSSLGHGGSGSSPYEIGEDDFRMTWIGTDGNTSPSVYEPESTYNSKDSEFIVVFEGSGDLSLMVDPKERWAQEHPEWFPVEILTAPKEVLLRVPGLGPVSARRICSGRRKGSFQGSQDLRKTGLVLKKAAPYLLLRGKPVQGVAAQPALPFGGAS